MSPPPCPRRSSRYAGQFRPGYSRLHEDPDLRWITPLPVSCIVGVIGRRFSGKSAALSWLADRHEFEVYGLGNLVREEARRRGVARPSRRWLRELGNELRAEHGDSVLAEWMLSRIRRHHLGRDHENARIAVSGFKHPAELEAFLPLARFQAIVLDARQRVRFDRAVAKAAGQTGQDDLTADLTLHDFKQLIDAPDRDDQKAFAWAQRSALAVDRVVAAARREQREQPWRVAVLDNNANDQQALEAALTDYVEAIGRRQQPQ